MSISRSQSGVSTELTRFLVCTSCTVSYIFASIDGETVESTASMTFTDDGSAVEVNFVNVDLEMTGIDGNTYSWNMDLGFIDPD